FGIDEAGRGPLAGPVSVAVFGWSKRPFDHGGLKDFPKGKDSKKMSEKEREKWMGIFEEEKRKGNVFFEQAFSSALVIDKKGIVFAINSAMRKCLVKLEKVGLNKDSTILLDGALRAPSEFSFQKTIIKGDEKERVIACASIVAKVRRDAFMIKISEKYSEYGLDVHKGYGTLKHQKAIQKHGLSNIHRKSFCKSILPLSN
ncbi:MAG: ribonuclease HII, partial [Candidatus Paceibacterota bacterium]